MTALSSVSFLGIEQLASKLASCLPAKERTIMARAGYGKRCGWGANPALLVVDATYGFCGRERKPILDSIAEQRRSCGEVAWDAVDQIAALIRQARLGTIPIIFSAMEDPSSPEYEPGLWATKNRRGNEGVSAPLAAEKADNHIVMEIAPRPGEMVFFKNKPSLFAGTGLLPYLIARKIDSLIICGGTTSGCVYATAVDGFSNNLKIAVVADASFDRIQTAHWLFLLDIDLKYGDVITCDAALEYLNGFEVKEKTG
jgi:maleamate amidohydrolase